MRYHLNPETGTPRVCKAEKRCRFGSIEDHYSSLQEAQEGFERLMATQTWPSKELPVGEKLSLYTPEHPTFASHSHSPGVNERRITTASCRLCSHPIDDYTHARLLTRAAGGAHCPHCSSKLSISKLKVVPHAKSAPLLTFEHARETTFYHATGRRGWQSILKTNKLIHMGELESAFDRALTYYNHGATSPKVVWAVYELRLKPEATYGARLRDTGVDLARSYAHESKPLKGDYNPYVNTYESPGSVSALAPAKSIEIAGVRTLRFKELHEQESLYTLLKPEMVG